MTRRTYTRHPTEADAKAKAKQYRDELRGYDPITRVYLDGAEWVVELDCTESCD